MSVQTGFYYADRVLQCRLYKSAGGNVGHRISFIAIIETGAGMLYTVPHETRRVGILDSVPDAWQCHAYTAGLPRDRWRKIGRERL